MTTIRYVLDNPDLTDAGYAFSEEMSRFVDAAAAADYSADEYSVADGPRDDWE